jgi:dephospho-CoA kinase
LTRTPLRVALTGGIATGKSHCLARFAALGVPVIDADELARIAVEPGTPALVAVVDRFGPGILHDDGLLNREALGRIVFADGDARQALEAIVHPAVYAAVGRWFEQLARWSGARIGLADIPLLYETHREADFDRVIVTSCRPEQQLDRLMRRTPLTEADARQRIDAQAPLASKAGRADYVIDTSGTLESTDAQVREVWEQLKSDVSNHKS